MKILLLITLLLSVLTCPLVTQAETWDHPRIYQPDYRRPTTQYPTQWPPVSWHYPPYSQPYRSAYYVVVVVYVQPARCYCCGR